MANLFDSTNTNQSISLTLTYDSCKNGYLTEFWLVGYEKESARGLLAKFTLIKTVGKKGHSSVLWTLCHAMFLRAVGGDNGTAAP